MAFVEIPKLYTVQCDRCKTLLAHPSSPIKEANVVARHFGWLIVNSDCMPAVVQHWCPACQVRGRDGNT